MPTIRLDIEDDLWRRVKSRAALTGITATTFVREALGQKLELTDEDDIVPPPNPAIWKNLPATRRPATAPGAVVPAGDPRANPAADTRQARMAEIPNSQDNIDRETGAYGRNFGTSRAAPKPGGKRK